MGGDDHRSTATDGAATVERTVDVQDQGAIVRLRVSTDHGGDVDVDVDVDVEDELPAGLAPDRVAFHPDHAPEEGEATAERVTFEGTVSDDDELLVVYGAEVDSSQVGDVALTDPRLTVSSDPPTRQGGVTGLIRRALGRGAATADGGSDAESSDSVGDFDSFPGEDEQRGAHEDARVAQPGDATSATGDREKPDDQKSLDDLEPAVTRVASEADEEAAATSGAEQDGETADEPADGETAATANATAGTALAAGAGGVAAALATELENDEVAESDLAVLRDELGEELAGSDAARLDHLQARVEEFGAYAETLGTFLDEEGKPDEVIADLRADIEALETEVSALRDLEADVEDVQGAVDDVEAEVAAAADERAALREDIDAAATEVAEVEDELGEEIEAVGAELADEIERVERQARAAREGVKSDLAEIETAIERVEEVREALEDAFAPLGTETAESERDDDAEQGTTDAEAAGGRSSENGSEAETETEAETTASDPTADPSTDGTNEELNTSADGEIDLSVVEEDSEDDPADGGRSLDL